MTTERHRLEALDRVAVWTPQPGPQLAAFLSPADQLLFGGAAGGGKSSLLVGLALTQHRNSLVIRREATQLVALVDEIAAIVGNREGLNAALGIWRLPGGRTIRLGGVPHPGDEAKYQGAARDLLALDEAANLLESQVRFLCAWVRSTDPKQRCRVVIASNPPTSGEGEWLVRWFQPWLDPEFPTPAKAGELRWVVMIPGEGERWVDGPAPFTHHGETIRPLSRTFIPSRISDNKYLAATNYGTILGSLPEPLRSQMLLGDFAAGREDSAFQVVPSEWVRVAQARWQEQARPATGMSALGVDVARGGRDRTILSPRWGDWFGPQVELPGTATPDGPAVAAAVVQHLKDNALVNVDVIGVGSSVYDTLRAQRDIRVAGLNGSESSEAHDRSGRLGFRNKRAEWWWGMREALDPSGGRDLALPPDPGLLADLCAPRWKLTASGIQVESKEDIIKRLGRSPDKGDAAVYGLAGGSSGLRGAARTAALVGAAGLAAAPRPLATSATAAPGVQATPPGWRPGPRVVFR